MFVSNHEDKIEIGSGSFGSVYLAVYKGSLVAIKKCRKDEHSKEEILNLRRFLDNNNKYKNLINIISLNENSKEMIFELCNRGNLEDYIKNNELSTLEIKFLLKQIVEGLQIIHSKGLIHRDMKPKNILLHEETIPKIGDFGESKALAKDRIDAETFKGTPGYISPQMVDGDNYTNKTDIFSLGVILYYMYYGDIPWTKKIFDIKKEFNMILIEPEINQIFENHPGIYIPDSAKDLIKKMLRKDENERYDCKKILEHPFLMNQQEKDIKTIKKTNSFLSVVGEVTNNSTLRNLIDEERKKEISRTISEKIYYEHEKVVFFNQIIAELHDFIQKKAEMKRITKPLILLLIRYCAFKSEYLYQYLKKKETYLYFKSGDWNIFYSSSFYQNSLRLIKRCRKTNSENLTNLLNNLSTIPEPYEQLLEKDYTPSKIFFKWFQREIINFFKYVANKNLMNEYESNEKFICLMYDLHLILHMKSIKSDFPSAAVNWEKYYENQSYEEVIEIMKNRINNLLESLKN